MLGPTRIETKTIPRPLTQTRKDRNEQNFCGLKKKDDSQDKQYYDKALYRLTVDKASRVIEPQISRPVLRDIPREQLEQMSKLDNSFNTDLNQSIEILVTPQKSPEEIEFENNEVEK